MTAESKWKAQQKGRLDGQVDTGHKIQDTRRQGTLAPVASSVYLMTVSLVNAFSVAVCTLWQEDVTCKCLHFNSLYSHGPIVAPSVHRGHIYGAGVHSSFVQPAKSLRGSLGGPFRSDFRTAAQVRSNKASPRLGHRRCRQEVPLHPCPPHHEKGRPDLRKELRLVLRCWRVLQEQTERRPAAQEQQHFVQNVRPARTSRLEASERFRRPRLF